MYKMLSTSWNFLKRRQPIELNGIESVVSIVVIVIIVISGPYTTHLHLAVNDFSIFWLCSIAIACGFIQPRQALTLEFWIEKRILRLPYYTYRVVKKSTEQIYMFSLIEWKLLQLRFGVSFWRRINCSSVSQEHKRAGENEFIFLFALSVIFLVPFYGKCFRNRTANFNGKEMQKSKDKEQEEENSPMSERLYPHPFYVPSSSLCCFQPFVHLHRK